MVYSCHPVSASAGAPGRGMSPLPRFPPPIEAEAPTGREPILRVMVVAAVVVKNYIRKPTPLADRPTTTSPYRFVSARWSVAVVSAVCGVRMRAPNTERVGAENISHYRENEGNYSGRGEHFSGIYLSPLRFPRQPSCEITSWCRSREVTPLTLTSCARSNVGTNNNPVNVVSLDCLLKETPFLRTVILLTVYVRSDAMGT
ncbi:hypothetical protein QTP88_014477 [Uroleucon formosanum]